MAGDDITQEQFDELLDWLNPDREQAALKYEWIRKRLIKIFVSRGRNNPEELTDRTINRVARMLPETRPNYTGDRAPHFYVVAGFIDKEWLREQKVPAIRPVPLPSHEDEPPDLECLQKCLRKLPERERDLVLRYYQQEKRAKIDHRKKIAEEMGLSTNAIRIRACRVRADLLRCVELCRSEGIG